MKEKIMLRSQAKSLEPVVRIGKSGLSDNIAAEIGKNLKKRKLIKIKLLKASFVNREKEELIKNLAQKTDSEIIEIVGNTVVLYRK